VAQHLQRLAREDQFYSAQLAAFHHGQCIVDLSVGLDFEEDGLIGVFSSSKGISALCLGILIDDRSLDPDQTVARGSGASETRDRWPSSTPHVSNASQDGNCSRPRPSQP
jgi:hypothetical protein